MTSHTLTGTLIDIDEPRSYGRSNERVTRRFAVEDQETASYKSPSVVTFDLDGDKCSLIDSFNPGETITVTFQVRGVSYTKDGQRKRFNKLLVLAVEPAEEAPFKPRRQAAPSPSSGGSGASPVRLAPSPQPTVRPSDPPTVRPSGPQTSVSSTLRPAAGPSPYMPRPSDDDSEAMPF